MREKKLKKKTAHHEPSNTSRQQMNYPLIKCKPLKAKLTEPQSGGGGQEPLNPSGSTPAPAAMLRAGCIAPHSGGFGGSPRGRPHSLWAVCASAPQKEALKGQNHLFSG